MGHMPKSKVKAKAKAKAKAEGKGVNNDTKWQESENNYESFELDLRPEYFEESHKNLMNSILALLEKTAENENMRLPKGKQKPTKVNGKPYTATGGAFLVRLLPDDPKEEVVTLLYGMKDIYLKAWNVGAIWFLIKELDVALPPSSQVAFKTRIVTTREREEFIFEDGIYFLSWSGSYLSLSAGRSQPFFYNAFGKAHGTLSDAENLVANKQDGELQPPVALYAIVVAECVRFPEIESSVIANTTDPLNIVPAPLEDHLIERMGQWGSGSEDCYRANPPEWVRVIKRHLESHLKLKVDPVYQKKKTQAIVQEEEEAVALRETIQGEGIYLMEGLKDPGDIVQRFVPDKSIAVRVKVMRLPDTFSEILEDHEEVLSEASLLDPDAVSKTRRQLLCAVQREAQAASKLRRGQKHAIFNLVMKRKRARYCKTSTGYMHHMCAFGGPNVLLASSSGLTFEKPPCDTQDPPRYGKLVPASHDVSKKLGFFGKSTNGGIDESAAAVWKNIVLGFQRATRSGPLCGEALWGLAFIIEPYAFDGCCLDMRRGEEIANTVEQACHAAVLRTKPRVCEMVHRCMITAPLSYLRVTQDMLRASRGLLLMAEWDDDCSRWMVHAEVPAAEVSTLQKNIRTVSDVKALIIFSHWVVNPGNPERQGSAKKLVERVRRRKKLE